MPAGRFEFIGEAARFAPSAGSVTVRFIGVEPGLAFVATRASGPALLHLVTVLAESVSIDQIPLSPLGTDFGLR